MKIPYPNFPSFPKWGHPATGWVSRMGVVKKQSSKNRKQQAPSAKRFKSARRITNKKQHL